MSSMLSVPLSLIIAALLSSVAAVLPITVDGNKFYSLQEDWTKSPESFTILGVNYQPGGTANFNINGQADVLSNAQICQRDAFLFRQLGINTIHVSAVSPWINHDQCMTILNNAGIYVMLDVNLPDSSISANNPAGTYTHDFLNNAFGLVDAFKNYPNFIGFFAGDSIVNSTETAQQDPAYVRAVVRDLKQYINRWANRTIPVGYGAGSDATWRYAMYEYLQCDAASGNSTADALARADFIGLQDFTWCGNSGWNSSDYGDILQQYNNSSVPIIFTSYGCDSSKPRTFHEVNEGLYGPLGDVLSGGFVSEYSGESDYGLVTIDSDENVSLRPDFENFKTALASVTYTPVTMSASATGTAAITAAPTCNSKLLPAQASGFNWELSLPPCPASNLILSNGGNYNVGEIMNFASDQLTYSWTLMDPNNSRLTPSYTYASSYKVNYQTNVPASASKIVEPYGSTLMLSTSKSTSSTSAQSTGSPSSASASTSAQHMKSSSLPTEGGSRKTSNDATSLMNPIALVASTSVVASLFFILV